MKTLFSRIILAISLTLGFSATSWATVYNFPQSDSVFTDSSYIIGGSNGDIDVFYFTNPIAGTYHFYSTGSTDVYGYIYSDTHATTLASNDDSATGYNFCVEAYLYAGENVSVVVTGYSSTSTGSYGIVGASGTCADSGYGYFDSNATVPLEFSNSVDPYVDPYVDPNADGVVEVSSFSLPVVLFSLLGLAAVRLRRLFA